MEDHVVVEALVGEVDEVLGGLRGRPGCTGRSRCRRARWRWSRGSWRAPRGWLVGVGVAAGAATAPPSGPRSRRGGGRWARRDVGHGDARHLDRARRELGAARRLEDRVGDLHAADDVPEDRVGVGALEDRAGLVVEDDEELRALAVGAWSVGPSRPCRACRPSPPARPRSCSPGRPCRCPAGRRPGSRTACPSGGRRVRWKTTPS